MEALDLLGPALRIGAAVVEAILAAAKAGDVSTVEALRAAITDPAALAELDRVLVATQRQKAAAQLRPTAETRRRAISPSDVTQPVRLPLERRPTDPAPALPSTDDDGETK